MSGHGLHLISQPGVITHQRRGRRGSTIDLAFSDIPEAYARVTPALGPACDHLPLLGRVVRQTPALPERGPRAPRMKMPREQAQIDRMVQYAALRLLNLPSPGQSEVDIDNCAAALATILSDAIDLFGSPCLGTGPKRKP